MLPSSQIMQLKEELESERVRPEDGVEDAALETLRESASALCEERDQLLEILRSLREEKSQIKTIVEEKEDVVSCRDVQKSFSGLHRDREIT